MIPGSVTLILFTIELVAILSRLIVVCDLWDILHRAFDVIVDRSLKRKTNVTVVDDIIVDRRPPSHHRMRCSIPTLLRFCMAARLRTSAYHGNQVQITLLHLVVYYLSPFPHTFER
jgi:hypothetical protein